MLPANQDGQLNDTGKENKDIPKIPPANQSPPPRKIPKVLPVAVTVARLVNDDGRALIDWELNFDMSGSQEKETGYLIIDLAKPTSVRLVKSGNKPAYVAVMSSSEPLVEISMGGAKGQDYAYAKLMHKVMFQQIGKARIDYFSTLYPHLKYQPADPLMIDHQKQNGSGEGSSAFGKNSQVIDTNVATKSTAGQRSSTQKNASLFSSPGRTLGVIGIFVLVILLAVFIYLWQTKTAPSHPVAQPQEQSNPSNQPATTPKAEEIKPWVPGDN